MKTKIILFALVIVLMAGLAIPAFASYPAYADGGRSTKGTNSPSTTTPTPVTLTSELAAPTSEPAARKTTTKMGPLMIGVGTSDNSFVGIAASIFLGGDGSLKLANLRFPFISLDGTFRLSLVYRTPLMPGGADDFGIVGGSLTSSRQLPKGNILSGSYQDMGSPNALNKSELQGNYIVMFEMPNASNPGGTDWFGGLLIGNLPGIVTLLPQILTAMGGPDISFLVGTLKTLVTLINPLMPKIIVIMPAAALMKLMPLMGM